MRFYRSHPILAAIAAVAVLTLAGGAAYAVARDVFISIDPAKPAPEIEQDIQRQLAAAGVPSSVQVEKADDGKLKVRVKTDHEADSDLADLKIHVNGMDDSPQLRLQLDVQCHLDDTQQAALVTAASGERIIALANDRGGRTDREVASAVEQVLHDAGFQDVDVAVNNSVATIKVKAPPVAN